MKDSDDILIKRLAIVAGVISLIMIVGICIAVGSVRKAGIAFLIIFIITFIAVCVLYFLIKWVYNRLKQIYVIRWVDNQLRWFIVKHTLFFRLIVVLSSLISIPVGGIYGVDSINRLSDPNTYLLYFGIIRIADPPMAFFTTFVTTAFQVFILTFTVGYVIRVAYNQLKWISARHTLFFRLMVVLSSLISIPVAVIYSINIVDRDVSWVVLCIICVAGVVVTFISIFTTGQVLYFTIRWVRDGSKGNQFYLRLTVMLSIISFFVGAFIAAVDMSRITTTRWDRRRGIADFIADYGVKETIAAVDVNPSITLVFVAAIYGAGVWIIYLSILWIYSGLDSDGDE